MSEKMKIADLVSKVKDYTSLHPREKNCSEIRRIDYYTIDDGGIIDFSQIGHEAYQSPGSFNSETLEPGDILITSSRHTQGQEKLKIVVIPEEGRGCCIDFNSHAFSLKPDIIKPELVAAYLSSPSIMEYIMEISNDETISRHFIYDMREKILALEIIVPEKKAGKNSGIPCTHERKLGKNEGEKNADGTRKNSCCF